MKKKTETQKRLEEFDAKVLAGLQANVTKAQHKLKQFKNTSCKVCRAIYDTYIKEFNGPVYAYGLEFKVEGVAVYCPKCGRCVWSED